MTGTDEKTLDDEFICLPLLTLPEDITNIENVDDSGKCY